jgi:hypothetical protein
MAKFTKYNNPNKKRKPKKYSRSDADIMVAKRAFDDYSRGVCLPLSFYDHMSDELCGNPSRHIYNHE